MKRLLKNRSLLTLALADGITNLGSWVTSMAMLSILVFKGDGGLGSTSLLLLAGLAPSAICGPLAGWLADRYPAKLLMTTSQILAGLSVTALIFTDNPLLIYPLLVLESAATALMGPARQTLVPRIVPAEDLSRANALLQQVLSTVKIGAPFLAGLLLAVVTPHQAMVLDVLSFAISALLLSRLPSVGKHAAAAPAAQASAGDAPTAPRSMREIWRSVPLLRALLPIQLLTPFIFMAVDVSFPVYIRDIVNGDQRYMGITVGLVGLGTLLGSGLLMLAKGERPLLRDLVGGLLVLIGIPFAFVLGAWLPLSLARIVFGAVVFLGSVGGGVANVQVQTLMQRVAPAGWLGRITGAMSSLSVIGALLGMLGTPLIVPHVLSFKWFFMLDSALLLGVALYAALLARSRTIPAGTTSEVHAVETTPA